MDLTWSTLEDLARTSDDAAVRRKYDRRNFAWLVALLIFFTVISLVETVADTHRKSVVDILIGAANLALTTLGLRSLWAPSTREWIRRRITVSAIVYTVVQYTLVLAFNRDDPDWIAWAMSMPWLMLGFRMFSVEHILMHALFAAGGVLMAFVSPARTPEPGIWIAIITLNAFVLALQLFFSTRLRKRVASEWNERRVQAREQLRMRDELQYARELQLSMLPECDPQLEWVDLCAVSIPATEVGGDYYDYFVEDDRVAVVCGDVAGHGMASGLVLAGLRSGFTLLRDSLHDPAAVLQRLHDLVLQTSRRRMLVTVSVVLLDRVTKRATIASAGHPPVIHRRAGGTVDTIELYAPPLGVKLPVVIRQRTIDVAPGDVLVLHSDGVYETRSAAGEDYGLHRLAEVVRDHGAGSAESLRNAILADVTAFRGTPEAADDVTLVVARIV